MQNRMILFLLYPVCFVSACVLGIPAVYAWVSGEPAWYMVLSMLALITGGICCFLGGRRHPRQLAVRDGAALLLYAWLLLSLAGMVPFGGSGYASWTEAWIMAVSAITTTGFGVPALVYDSLPSSLLLWHSFLAWLGGMQFLVFSVTIIPLVNPSAAIAVQGRQHVSFSPMVHPMFGRAGKVMVLYGVLTVLALAVCWYNSRFSGSMTGLNIVRQALLLVSTAGGTEISSAAIWPAIAVCYLTGGNFLLYLRCWERRSLRVMLHDAEWCVMLGMILLSGMFIACHLHASGIYTGRDCIEEAFFPVLSFMSTGGMMTEAWAAWPAVDTYILLIWAFIGSSMASPGGGIKIMRLVILIKTAKNEIDRMIHPHMVVAFSVRGKSISVSAVQYVLAYFFLFMAVFFMSALLFSLAGITPLQAMGTALGCLSSTGTAAVLVGIQDMSSFPLWLQLYAACLMILGRIEILAFLLLVKTGIQSLRRPW